MPPAAGSAAAPPPGTLPSGFEVGDRVEHRWLGEGIVERIWWRDDHWHIATDRFGAPPRASSASTERRLPARRQQQPQPHLDARLVERHRRAALDARDPSGSQRPRAAGVSQKASPGGRPPGGRR
ncbi:MAG: hypothetical protein R3F43_29245 [bacterium]